MTETEREYADVEEHSSSLLRGVVCCGEQLNNIIASEVNLYILKLKN
jgi:hypothetical protein